MNELAGGTDQAAPGRRQLVGIVRFVEVFIALGLLWKIRFFLWADGIYSTYLLRDPFFPMWLQSELTLRIAFVLVVCGCVAAFLHSSRVWMLGVSATQWVALSVLVVHQGSYNDMTFVTAWWTSLWITWLLAQVDRSHEVQSLHQAARLGCVILSLIMLGAAVGKWTEEYWSGLVFYEIYFRDRDFYLYNWLRSSFDENELQRLALVYARTVIVTETICGFCLAWLPPRIAGALGVVLMLLIPLMNNLYLFSVTFPLLGLAAAVIVIAFKVPRPADAVGQLETVAADE